MREADRNPLRIIHMIEAAENVSEFLKEKLSMIY